MSQDRFRGVRSLFGFERLSFICIALGGWTFICVLLGRLSGLLRFSGLFDNGVFVAVVIGVPYVVFVLLLLIVILSVIRLLPLVHGIPDRIYWPCVIVLVAGYGIVPKTVFQHSGPSATVSELIEERDVEGVQAWLERHERPDYIDPHGLAPLHYAACIGDREIVDVLLSAGAKVDVRSAEGGLTPLMVAADGEIASLLLRHGADPNSKHDIGLSPLHFAVNENREGVVDVLLENGANPNATTEKGGTPLRRAAQKGSIGIMELLIEHGALVDAADTDGFAPLHCAVMATKATAVQVLASAGADVNAQIETYGYTPLHMAVLEEKVEIARRLLEHGADPSIGDFNYGMSPLFYALSLNSDSMVRLLTQHGADVNKRNPVGMTPLHVAATAKLMKQRAEVLYRQQGIRPDFRGEWTPADIESNATIIDLLIRHGSRINARDTEGRSPLSVAIMSENRAAALDLLERGAAFRTSDLAQASARAQLGVVSALLARGADPNDISLCRPVLCHAVVGGSTEIINLLLDHGADLEKERTPGSGGTALHCAASSNRPQIARLLIERGAKVEGETAAGKTLLHSAARAGNVDLAAILVERGFDLDHQDIEGWTPLCYAVWHGKSQMVRFLLDHGANPRLGSEDEGTPLHLAARRGSRDMIEVLLESGADLSARNALHETPYDSAATAGTEDVLDLLQPETGPDEIEPFPGTRLGLRLEESAD